VGAHKDEFLESLKLKPQDTVSPTLILPELPQPICDMNGRTLCSILTGIGKDLAIDWKGDKPEWWPNAVPFVHPRETPPQLKDTLYILRSYSFNISLQENYHSVSKQYWKSFIRNLGVKHCIIKINPLDSSNSTQMKMILLEEEIGY